MTTKLTLGVDPGNLEPVLTDRAHRALLRAPGIVNRCDLLTAYVLGDPLPEPICPETYPA